MSILDFLRKNKNSATSAAGANESQAQAAQPKQTSKADAEEPVAKAEQHKPIGENAVVRNLIILDASGSMASIFQPTITGLNETLQTIREAQIEHPEQKHFVTLVSFNTSHFYKIYNNTPASETIDIAESQYRPSGGTPLYDAMGRSFCELRMITENDDYVLVTILTDGYENASREYSGHDIKQMVQKLRNNCGWVFTYIGANQDVEAVAESMAINNRMAFSSSQEGTKAMFDKEMSSRKIFFNKISEKGRSSIEDNYFDA